MGKRKQRRVQESEIRRTESDFNTTLEQQVEDLLFYGRHLVRIGQDSAFVHRHIGPKGTRYLPFFGEKIVINLYQRGLLKPAILKERIDSLKRIIMKYDQHFPSSPQRTPKYGVFFRDLSGSRLSQHGFCTAVAMKAFVDEVIRYLDEKPRWLNPQEMQVGSIHIRSIQLEEIMETNGSIVLPYPYTSYAAQIAGRITDVSIPIEDDAPKQRKERTKREPQAPRAKRSEGSTSASDIASTLGLEPSAARRILRAANVEKPYAWTDQSDIDRITKILESGKKK